MNPLSQVQAAVFDMDGLLLDTERIARMAWEFAAQEVGHTMTDAIFAQAVGRRAEDDALMLVRELGADFPLAKFRERTAFFHKNYIETRGIPMKPGVMEILDWCKLQGLPCAVATSTQSPIAQHALEKVGLLDRFKTVVTGEMVTRGKPAPDIYIKAAGELGAEPKRCLAFEDSHFGVEAAAAAEMMVFMIPDLLPADDKMRELAYRVEDSLLDAKDFLTASLKLGKVA